VRGWPPQRQGGTAIGLIAQLLLLVDLASTVGLGAAGWVAGLACAGTTTTLLARALVRRPREWLGPASWITLGRETLVVGVAALVVDSFVRPVPVGLIVTLTSVALAADLVDGWVARRTGSATELGARFDGEVDAFLLLVLSLYVARDFGPWVLLIGAARYLFMAGESRPPACCPMAS
jgi:phosphatidylglycerophosphate synthase